MDVTAVGNIKTSKPIGTTISVKKDIILDSIYITFVRIQAEATNNISKLKPESGNFFLWRKLDDNVKMKDKVLHNNTGEINLMTIRWQYNRCVIITKKQSCFTLDNSFKKIDIRNYYYWKSPSHSLTFLVAKLTNLSEIKEY